MAEAAEESKVESSATPERQVEAERLGWIPAARYKGAADKFIDAEDFIARGEQILPLVKKQNEVLRNDVNGLRQANANLQASLEKAQKAIDDIEERHSVETQRAVEQARRDLKSQLAKASEAGDHEAVAEITSQMTELSVAEGKKEEKKEEKPVVKQEQQFVPPQDLTEWQADHPWFGKDKKKTQLALVTAQELRESGETSTGRVFYDKVAAEVDAYLGRTESPKREDKVEGSRNSGNGEHRGNGKGYNSLPADAKATCDADSRRFVGDGKKYKDIAAYRAGWASIYFSQE